MISSRIMFYSSWFEEFSNMLNFFNKKRVILLKLETFLKVYIIVKNKF